MTTQSALPWPMSIRRAPSDSRRRSSASWSSPGPAARSICSRFLMVLASGTETNIRPGPRSSRRPAVASTRRGGAMTTSSSASRTTGQPRTSAHQRPWAVTSRQSTTTVYQRRLMAQTYSAVPGPPDQAQARPVLVDGGHLDVDQAEVKGVLPDDVIGDVAVVAGRPAGPGGPQRAGRGDPPGQRGQPVRDLGPGPEERDDHVGGAVRAGAAQAVGWFAQLPAGWRFVERDPVPRLEAQLASLGGGGVPGGHALRTGQGTGTS